MDLNVEMPATSDKLTALASWQAVTPLENNPEIEKQAKQTKTSGGHVSERNVVYLF